jgi:protein-S-isoprenylcysteine O-methyltransferase Ste14
VIVTLAVDTGFEDTSIPPYGDLENAPHTMQTTEPAPDGSRIPALGPRGEGWVAIQSALIVAVILCAAFGAPWPRPVEPELRIAGFAAEAAGFALFVAARVTLGTSFTVLPRPRERATLRRHGVYAHARHPVYGGLIVLGIGLALHRSALVFAPTAALGAVFLLKSMREEAWLAARYPDYAGYRRATPRRFVPWIV